MQWRKTLVTFRDIYWLINIGILIMAYHTPPKTLYTRPQHHPNNHVFFFVHCSLQNDFFQTHIWHLFGMAWYFPLFCCSTKPSTSCHRWVARSVPWKRLISRFVLSKTSGSSQFLRFSVAFFFWHPPKKLSVESTQGDLSGGLKKWPLYSFFPNFGRKLMSSFEVNKHPSTWDAK